MTLTPVQLAAYFLIASVIGWGMDTVIRSIRRKHWAPIRKVPFSPLYGVAALAVLFVPEAVRAIPLWGQYLYFACAFTAVEYVGGVLILRIVRRRIWDYSDRFLNIDGHVDAFHFVLWGALGLLALHGLHPQALWAVSHL